LATKLKNISTYSVVKISAFLLTVIMMSTSVLQVRLGMLRAIDVECITTKEYRNSTAFQEDVKESLNQVIETQYSYDDFIEVPYYYFIKYGYDEKSNVGHNQLSFYKKFNTYFILQKGVWIEGATGDQIQTVEYINSLTIAYVAFPEAYFDQKQQEWDRNRSILLPYLIRGVCFFILGLLLMVILVHASGKQPQDQKIHLGKVDRIPTDISLLAACFFVNLYRNNLKDIFQDETSFGFRIHNNNILILTDFKGSYTASLIEFTIIFTVFICLLLAFILSFSRKWKAGILIRDNLISKFLLGFLKKVQKIYHRIYYGRIYQREALTLTLYKRQQVLIYSTIIMIFTSLLSVLFQPFLAVIPIALEMLIIYWYYKGNKQLYKEIDQGIQDSFEEQMKSERMKVALITNVSHDLKTPLTSIISYTDLLSKEEGLTETAADYIRILQDKSMRLKNMVTDLFELAKSTSGDISLNMEVIDLKKLMEQTLADMQDRVEESMLQFKVTLGETPVNIRADGGKLYRVFQNIIDNALKYAMRGTRVFIKLEEVNKEAVVTIKNIAGYEMNFTADEILQRFVRGDQSRTTEGSGLGLSIAESFTRNCGGRFKLDINDDVFQVTVSFEEIIDVAEERNQSYSSLIDSVLKEKQYYIS
jgi:signal transduction histidine kinase